MEANDYGNKFFYDTVSLCGLQSYYWFRESLGRTSAVHISVGTEFEGGAVRMEVQQEHNRQLSKLVSRVRLWLRPRRKWTKTVV